MPLNNYATRYDPVNWVFSHFQFEIKGHFLQRKTYTLNVCLTPIYMTDKYAIHIIEK